MSDRIQDVAEAEARLKSDPNNRMLHWKWIEKRILATSTPDGQRSAARTTMIAWAVTELQRLRGQSGHTQDSLRFTLASTAHYLAVLERWREAGEAYDQYWDYLVKQGIEFENLDWMALEEAADAYSNCGRMEEAKQALYNWLAGAEREGTIEDWRIEEIVKKIEDLRRS